jgi:hypothetical protein
LSNIADFHDIGELPEKDTVCKADAIPFGPTPGGGSVLDIETSRMMERQARFHKALFASGGGFMPNGLNANMGRLPWH